MRQNAIVESAGRWFVSLELDEGIHVIEAQAVDSAGNTSPPSAAVNVRVEDLVYDLVTGLAVAGVVAPGGGFAAKKYFFPSLPSE